jgi:hypothetical protein
MKMKFFTEFLCLRTGLEKSLPENYLWMREPACRINGGKHPQKF